jgi:V8-like Glu-specific endopeptidase
MTGIAGRGHRVIRGIGVASLLAAGLIGCGEGQSEPVSEVSDPITGGTLLTSTTDVAPFTSVGILSFSYGFCTGTKVGTKTFVTAAHCVVDQGTGTPELNPGDAFVFSNSRNGTSGTSFNLTVAQVLPHVTSGMPGKFGYDVALIRVNETTTSVPALSSPYLPDYVNPGRIGKLIAYGCDNLNPSHAGKKQSANFTTTIRNVTVFDIYTFWSSGGNPQVCPGDSGSPLFMQNSSGAWKIAGITSGNGVDPQGNPGSSFARIGDVRQWLLDPRIDVFTAGQKGFLINWDEDLCATALKSTGTSTAVQDQYCDGRTAGATGTGDTQYWKLAASTTVSGGWKLMNTKDSGCLRRTGLNSFVTTDPCTSANAVDEDWLISGDGPFQTFVDPVSGGCLDLSGGFLFTVPCTGSASEAWAFSN